MVTFLAQAAEAAQGRPVLIDKFLDGREVEVDAICDGETVLIPGIMEHIETRGRALGRLDGRLPAAATWTRTKSRRSSTTRERIVLGHGRNRADEHPVRRAAARAGRRPARLRARSEPAREPDRAVPLEGDGRADGAARGRRRCWERRWPNRATRAGSGRSGTLVAVKAPVFSMSKLIGVDTYLGPEMKSTGEVMGIDRTFEAALAKALLAVGPRARSQARPSS